MATIPWLGDVLRAEGLQVVAQGDWVNRMRPGAFEPRGVLWHHTAGALSGPNNPHPSMGVVINGRPELPGPLCHALIDYFGVFHLISAGRANHAGEARASGPIPAGDGNTMLIGWEIDYAGDQPTSTDQAMSPAQYQAAVRGTAAVLRRLGRDASYARGHRETSVTGKIDPSYVDLNVMRADVAAALNSPPSGARTVAALTPQRTAVMRFNGSAGSWTQIGGPAQTLYGGGGLAATTPSTGDIMRHLGSGRWERAGGPGAAFAFGGSLLYGLTPGRTAVMAYNGSPDSWTQIGGPAKSIHAGAAGLVATTPASGEVMRYGGAPGNWQQIGGPSGEIAVSGGAIYAETPSQSAIMRYNGSPHSWTQIGGPGSIQYAGGYGLLAINPTTSSAMLYRQSTGWVHIGGPGKQFVVTDDTVFALTSDGNAVMRYNGTPDSWTQVGGPAAQIVPSP
jgi:hypothetical protein